MRFGILSDTHKKLDRAKKAVDFLLSQEIDFLIHAGDIGRVELLEYLHEKNINYVAVLGNNDHHLLNYQDEYRIVTEPYAFKFRDVTFKLMHIPYYLNPDSNVIIYGHTHTFDTHQRNGSLYINPGEVCARNKHLSELAVLEVQEKQYHLTRFTRTPGTNTWEDENFIYKRDNNE